MIADDDPIAQRLREAVWADPIADAPRMVYADYLLDHGDPLGELIALQLERARTGERVSARERELMVHATRMLGPVERGLAGWRLERGFLHAITPRDESFPVELMHHPMWSTVERMTLARDASHPLLDSRSLGLRTLHVGYQVLGQLARRTSPIPCAGLAGTPKLALSLYRSEDFDHRGAFARVRAISVEGNDLDRYMLAVLERPLFQQLEHLDLTFGVNGEVQFPKWQAWLESTQLTRLSARLPLQDDISESVGSYNPSTYVWVEIERGGDRVILQLDDTLYPNDVAAATNVVTAIAGPRRRVVVEDLADPNRCAEARADVLAALRANFEDVVVAAGPVRSRAP